MNRPFRPVPVKYSALAKKVMRRLMTSGLTKLSTTAKWLLARITGPESGIYSRPSVFGLATKLSNGPMKTYLNSQYHMDPPGSGHTFKAFGQLYPGRVLRVSYRSSKTIGIC